MRRILFFTLLLLSSFNLFAQDISRKNEDVQGEIYSNLDLDDINRLLKISYPYGHKTLYIEGDSIFHINENGKRRVKLSDINTSSITFENEKSDYKIFIKCKNGQKKMVADWGTYDNFNFVVKGREKANEIASKFKNLLRNLGY